MYDIRELAETIEELIMDLPEDQARAIYERFRDRLAMRTSSSRSSSNSDSPESLADEISSFSEE